MAYSPTTDELEQVRKALAIAVREHRHRDVTALAEALAQLSRRANLHRG